MKRLGIVLAVIGMASTPVWAQAEVSAPASGEEQAVSNEVVDANAPLDMAGMTPLHLAARANQLKAIQELMEKGADVNCKTRVGQTPLHFAAQASHCDAAEYLLLHGAQVNAQDANGLTPLHLAVQYGHVDLIEVLLQNHADLNARTVDTSLTPLHWAAFWGHTEGVKTLVTAGADPNALDSIGDTPMEWAEEYQHFDMARLLARLGGKRHWHHVRAFMME